jgi:hypothetical protein
MGPMNTTFWRDFWAGLAGPGAYLRYVVSEASDRPFARSEAGAFGNEAAAVVHPAVPLAQSVPAIAGTARSTAARTTLAR